MIELRALHAAAGAFRLTDIALTLAPGECHVIVGPTGSGKTMLLETILGLRPTAAGAVLIDGRDVTALPPEARHVSYVPQDVCLFPTLSVRENIRFGIDLRAAAGGDDPEFLTRLIDTLRLGDLLDRRPAHLSGGERQRAALARALATKPALLALDEPFSAIDQTLREEIRRMLKELLEAFRTTTLVVTHDLDEAFFLGDRLSLLLGGRIVQSGPREEVYYYPHTLAAAGFLGIRNLFRGHVAALTEQAVTLESAEWGRPVAVPCRCARKKFRPGQPLCFGIRAEAVGILAPGDAPAAGSALFDARIRKIYVRGRWHTLVADLAPPGTAAVEVDFHDADARRLDLAEGAPARLHIPLEHVFLIQEYS